MKTIDRFDGEWAFLSNFWPVEVELDGMIFRSSEHAFQAAKTHNLKERLQIQAAPTPGKAKRMGRRVTLRLDWEQAKLNVMRDLLWKKFKDPVLRAKLLATGDAELVEGNHWGDTVWGVCDGVGENWLGKLLMLTRAAIQIEEDLKKEV